jgi:hypothetical protein
MRPDFEGKCCSGAHLPCDRFALPLRISAPPMKSHAPPLGNYKKSHAPPLVLRKYASMSDILSLGWLPVVERRHYHLAKLVFKAIHSSDWPSYLKLDEYEPSRPLRSSSSRRLVVPRVSGTFQGEAARVFNDLPEDIRNSNNFRECCRNCFAHLRDLAMNKISNI